MRKLNLDDLKAGHPGISPDVGKYLVEAAAFCLVENGHESGTILKIEGDFNESLQLFWSNEIDEQVKRTWKDTNEAAEYGATAIGALLLVLFAELVVFERIPPSGDADYYLQSISSNKIEALLEVSGIWKKSKGNTSEIRVRVKKNRITKSSSVKNLPIFIVVTEFSEPKSKISKYE